MKTSRSTNEIFGLKIVKKEVEVNDRGYLALC